jgi:hypothetical protein
VLIGAGAGDDNCKSTHTTQCAPPDRSYLVFPHIFRDASIIGVERFADTPSVKVLPGYAFLVIGIWVTCAWVLWRNVRGKIFGSA